MTLETNNSELLLGSQEQFEVVLQQTLRQAIRVAIVSVLEAEVDAFSGAFPINRVEQRRDQRYGHYTRDLETLTGSKPSPSTVSRVFHTLEAGYEQWKTRRLKEYCTSGFADGTYFTVIYQDEGCKMPILAVIGIRRTGEREMLAFYIGDRKNEQAWRDLFDDLKARGVKEIGLWVNDGN